MPVTARRRTLGRRPGRTAARCVELGAERVEEQPRSTWIVLRDPAGHPFCLTDAANWG